MQFFKYITEGGCLPKGYGVVWRYCDRLGDIVCCPVPLNLLIRAGYHLWFKVKKGWFKSSYEIDLHMAKIAGYKYYESLNSSRLMILKK